MSDWSDLFRRMPLVAILRGLTPETAVEVGDRLVERGFTVLEVPLNSPDPLESIARLAKRHGDQAIVGAGTVLSAADVAPIADAGGTLVVMPHSDPAVIAEAKHLGLVCVPGVATPTEAFAALAAGADLLKLFPAELLSPDVVKAWRAVLPDDAALVPVGGITPDAMAAYWAAGAAGFGLGSALYRPSYTANEVGSRAEGFIKAFRRLPPRTG